MRNEELNTEEGNEKIQENKQEKSPLFEQIIALSIYRQMPEDYWEKEGTGWK